MHRQASPVVDRKEKIRMIRVIEEAYEGMTLS